MISKVKTKEFIKAMTDKVNETVLCYYEEADTNNATFPYTILSGINIIDLAYGDLTSFYLDIYTDEKLPSATTELESLCDSIRNALTDAVISAPGIFAAHIGFTNQNPVQETEYDISHRRISLEARIFYY